MSHWDLFGEVVSASKTLRGLHDYIVGGALTQSLTAIGDVHFRSAIDHLAQVPASTRPEQRLSEAAGDLQVAYFAYSASAKRGVPGLRRFLGADGLTRARGLAAGCAANIAALQLLLEEAPQNRRQWLDRVALQVSQYWEEAEARSQRAGMFSEIWVNEDFHSGLVVGQYFELERQLLPIEFLRAKPLGRIPSPELPPGTVFDAHNPDHMLPRIPPGLDW